MSYAAKHLAEVIEIVRTLNPEDVEKVADLLATVKA